MKIAIFDDNQQDRTRLTEIVQNWSTRQTPALTTVHTFETINHVLTAVLSGHFYDLYFLDIMTEEAHDAGFSLAERIRQADIRAVIIFTTNSPEYMASAFEVSAYRYLVKPVQEQQIQELLDRLCASMISRKAQAGEFQGVDGRLIISYADIVYIESLSFHHKARIFLTNGTAKEISLSGRSFSTFSDSELPDDFFRCHRGFVINLGHITGYGRDSVTLCDTITLPVSREQRSTFLTRLIDYHKEIL